MWPPFSAPSFYRTRRTPKDRKKNPKKRKSPRFFFFIVVVMSKTTRPKHLCHVPERFFKFIHPDIVTQKPDAFGRKTLSVDKTVLAIEALNSIFCDPRFYGNDNPFDYYEVNDKPNWEGKKWDAYFESYARAYNQVFCLLTGETENPIDIDGLLAHMKTKSFEKKLGESSQAITRDEEMIFFHDISPTKRGLVHIAQNKFDPKFSEEEYVEKIRQIQKAYVSLFEDSSLIEEDEYSYTKSNLVIGEQRSVDKDAPPGFFANNISSPMYIGHFMKPMLLREANKSGGGCLLGLWSYLLMRMMLNKRIELSAKQQTPGKNILMGSAPHDLEEISNKVASKILQTMGSGANSSSSHRGEGSKCACVTREELQELLDKQIQQITTIMIENAPDITDKVIANMLGNSSEKSRKKDVKKQ